MKQREIKFRAMYHDTADNTMKFAYGLVGWMDEKVVQLCVPNGKPIMRADTMNCIPGTLGQFTGLQDKNGKDIYEGDVIVADSYPFFNDGVPGYVGVVEWEYAAWYYTLWCINPNLFGSAIGDQLGANGNDATRFRVIGNIYENPELLPTNTTEG